MGHFFTKRNVCEMFYRVYLRMVLAIFVKSSRDLKCIRINPERYKSSVSRFHPQSYNGWYLMGSEIISTVDKTEGKRQVYSSWKVTALEFHDSLQTFVLSKNFGPLNLILVVRFLVSSEPLFISNAPLHKIGDKQSRIDKTFYWSVVVESLPSSIETEGVHGMSFLLPLPV